MRELADVKVSDNIFESMINSTLADLNMSQRASENVYSEIEIAWHDSPTLKSELRNTGYGALHAVTEYWDHKRNYRSGNSQFSVNQYGLGSKHRKMVADKLLAMAK